MLDKAIWLPWRRDWSPGAGNGLLISPEELESEQCELVRDVGPRRRNEPDGRARGLVGRAGEDPNLVGRIRGPARLEHAVGALPELDGTLPTVDQS